MVIRRGQIWWVDFGDPRGSEPAYRHPALVIQRDEVNESRIDTVVVCVLTSNPRLAKAPGNTLLRRRQTGLTKDSVANASQLATVNKSDLDSLVETLPSRVMDEVDEGLRWFLALDRL
ncbi:MAG: type II toxin-antitoxin system PemK/MazF family toxin [Deltaproteobacteria bacterium]|nr:type II toxin-antitoxin system PemK/MazF family toxin [Deltaproteobacteria bacterium]